MLWGRARMTKQGSVIASLSDQLRWDISLGSIKPGDKLNIEAIKRAHNVSHPSVREALSKLVGEGYVSFEESKGFRALQASLAEQKDNSRVRAELESLAFAWSVERSSVDWRAKVVAAHYALAEVEQNMLQDPRGTALEWDERNRAFHFALAENCSSARLLGLLATEYDLGRRYRLMAHAEDKSHSSRSRWIARSASEHDQLKQAALEGDIAMGQSVLKGHITKATLHVIGEGPGA